MMSQELPVNTTTAVFSMNPPADSQEVSSVGHAQSSPVAVDEVVHATPTDSVNNLPQLLFELEEAAQNISQYFHALHIATSIPDLTPEEQLVLQKHIAGSARPSDTLRLQALVMRIRLREARQYEWVPLTDPEIAALRLHEHDEGARQRECSLAIERILQKKNGFSSSDTGFRKNNHAWRKLTFADIASIPVPCFPSFSLQNNCSEEGAKMFARAIDAALMAKNYKPKSSLLRNDTN